jgi:hypothetical protein
VAAQGDGPGHGQRRLGLALVAQRDRFVEQRQRERGVAARRAVATLMSV